MHRSHYQIFSDLRLICAIYSGEISGDEMADHIHGIVADIDGGHAWNALVDLRSFIGDMRPSSLGKIARLLTCKKVRAGNGNPSSEPNGRIAVVSYNTGQKFMVNLARVYIRGHDIRYFSDMRQGYAWACGRDSLPIGMAELDWHLAASPQPVDG